MVPTTQSQAIDRFHPTLRQWFSEAFDGPTDAQSKAWPAIADGENTLLLAPTGSGKTLAAFLVAIDRIMFAPDRAVSDARERKVQVLYISPLKALGVDVERNLRAPIAGVKAIAERDGVDHHVPIVGIRSGDTSTADRYRLNREPPDILITTPESLFLMLTSRARDVLTEIDTVIVDEIHSMVPTKRGSHLFVSLERLEKLRATNGITRPLQRIGLSATQRPLDEVAALLGGASWCEETQSLKPRKVQTVEAADRKAIDLRIEVPVEDMSELAASNQVNSVSEPAIPSIWPSIHPRLVELIRGHRSTMIFVNSRRLAERLASAINELADETIARAHHGSIAKATRLEIEDQLKRGNLPAIVATSSLELGIDMGAVDLVIQIEAPPSIASGIQRIGRSGHQVGGQSAGVVFPKYRGDLLASSAAAVHIVGGRVEQTYFPRNPLDVLAQQLVAMVALESVPVDDLFAVVRQAAPFHDLPRNAFDNVLDLLAGRYPSDEFSELRPRVNWDRVAGQVSPRRGTQRLAILNAGTIPDRGLYGVYLAGSDGTSSRVGELDEEMVFETNPGDVFLLGASSWRVMDITQDRVIVTPAPGEPGRMPFWRGDGPGRPLEFGQAIGQLTRQLLRKKSETAQSQLVDEHGLDAQAAANLLSYLRDQVEATGEPPSDQTIVVESFLDEVGDWRVAILSPFGGRVHAPWATAVVARLRAETGIDVDMVWSDDGIVFRLPEADDEPNIDLFFPDPDEIEEIVTRELASTAMFAARFRENAARALLLPKRQPGRRSPLWLQRRRATDLLNVVTRFQNFPILIETYRECLRDVFDIKGLKQILGDVKQRAIRVRAVKTQVASPFAASLMFNYTANFIYDGDTPLAERRAQTLALDQSQLRELLGDAELRELLDANAVDELKMQLQRLTETFQIRHEDALNDMLRHLGDLSHAELSARCASSESLDQWLESLTTQRRVIKIRVGGELRYAAVEDAGRFRDALGIVPPRGLPDAFLESVENPVLDLVARFARTHIPFKADDVATRLGLGIAVAQSALIELVTRGRLLEGEFLPGGRGREWCDPGVLKKLKQRSLARLRQQVAPVDQEALARFLPQWQCIAQPRRGLDGLLDIIEQLQGLPLPASEWEQEVFTRRLVDYQPSDLDELCATGEVVWRGVTSLGSDDGRIAFYLTDHFLKLAPPAEPVDHELAQQILDLLKHRGALFFDEIVRTLGGFRNDLFDGLWLLLWAGHVTNDTLAPLRSFRQQKRGKRSGGRRRSSRGAFRSRRVAQQPGSEGRWSLLVAPETELPATTERQVAVALQLVERYGVLTREMVTAEGIRGGFSGIYPVLKAMEEAGKLRRGYFVAGLGAAQFAAPGAEDRLRDFAELHPDQRAEPTVLAANDPANPYGAALSWPTQDNPTVRPQRAAGARVIIHNGMLIGFLSRTGQHLLSFIPESDPERHTAACGLARCLAALAAACEPVLLSRIDGEAPQESPLKEHLLAEGFIELSKGLLNRGQAADQV